MSAHRTPGAARPSGRRGAHAPIVRLVAACALGVAAALLVSCGSSGKGLIPSAAAGPLQRDFEEVSQAAQNGNGVCASTESAIAKTEQDYNALPATLNAGLRSRLREGITNLRARALALCAQPLSTVTTTGTTAKTTTTPTTTATTPTVTQTTPTTTTPTTTTPTTPTTPSPGGGTPAPGETPPGGSEGGNGGVGAGGVGPGQEGGR